MTWTRSTVSALSRVHFSRPTRRPRQSARQCRCAGEVVAGEQPEDAVVADDPGAEPGRADVLHGRPRVRCQAGPSASPCHRRGAGCAFDGSHSAGSATVETCSAAKLPGRAGDDRMVLDHRRARIERPWRRSRQPTRGSVGQRARTEKVPHWPGWCLDRDLGAGELQLDPGGPVGRGAGGVGHRGGERVVAGLQTSMVRAPLAGPVLVMQICQPLHDVDRVTTSTTLTVR